MVTTGWRRSWLAAARKRVFVALAACSAAVRWATRCSSTTARRSSWASARTRRRTSNQAKAAITIGRPNGCHKGCITEIMPKCDSVSCALVVSIAANAAATPAKWRPRRPRAALNSSHSATRVTTYSGG